jgi:hypothetical protein
MAKKRTKADRAQRKSDQLDKKLDRRPAQARKKRPTGVDVNQAAAQIAREATEE